MECLKVLSGVGESASGKFITYDMMTSQFNNFKLSKSKSCDLCGENASIKTLITQQEKCELELKSSINIDEFKEIYEREQFELLDIRENAEQELFPLPYSTRHIPLSELKQRLNELDSKKLYCTLCQYGERSRKAYLILKKNAIQSYYLNEGMDKLL